MKKASLKFTMNVDFMNEQFGIDASELQDLMQSQGSDAVGLIYEYGGIDGLCELLNTDPKIGINATETKLEMRRVLFGANSIDMAPPKTFIELVIEALHDSTLIILEIAAFLSLLIVFYKRIRGSEHSADLEYEKYEWIEGVAILLSILIVVLVTAFNDYSKELQFRGLQERLDEEHRIPVIRDGEITDIPIQEVVVGDICLITYGNFVPADGILISGDDLKIDESSLTGEPELVHKHVDTDPMVLSGSSVMEGSGRILITAVGSNSQSGIILELLGVNHSIDHEMNDLDAKRNKAIAKQNISALIIAKSKTEIEISKAMDEKRNSETNDKTKINHKQKRERSILQNKLLKLAITIGKYGTVIAVLTVFILIVQFLLEFFQRENTTWQAKDFNNIIDYVIIGVSVLVVAVPEGLPLAVTLSLAYSVKKMMKDNNLVRHLDACETMGNATTICSDKTGTLTTNRMTVVKMYVCDTLYHTLRDLNQIPKNVELLITEGIAINSLYSSKLIYSVGEAPKQAGNKTECALLGLVNQMGGNYELIRKNMSEDKIVQTYTFNSVRKSMSTIIKVNDHKYRIYTKGAAEIILDKCTFIHDYSGEINELTEDMRIRLNRKVIEPMANSGLRTIALAYRELIMHEVENINQHLLDGDEEPNWKDEAELIKNLTFLSVTGIEDPVRPEVPNAIVQCQRAGITIRMVTGDNINTARSIAVQCGIIKSGDNSIVIDSKEFNQRIHDENGEYNQNLFDQLWPRLRVLARSSPTDKYVLVKGIIASKLNPFREVVAVTGDGTNDGPALKKADVGFAMGIAGTEVAKEASDIIITDDNFLSIVKAVMWGRNVYDSISKFLQFQLTVNIVAVIIAFIGACFIRNSPLRAVQLLWVNIIMDTLASLALATERPNQGILNRRPDGRTKPIISPIMLKNILLQAFYQLTVLLLLLFYLYEALGLKNGKDSGKQPSEHFTIIFNTLVMMTLFNEISSRKVHGERNVFKGLTKNMIFLSIWMGTFISQICIIQFGTIVFHTKPLDIYLWSWSFGFGIGTLIWTQLYMFIPIEKWFEKLYHRYLPTEEDNIRLSHMSTTDYYHSPPNTPHNTPRTTLTRASLGENEIKPFWLRGSRRLTSQLRVFSNYAVNADERRAELTREVLSDRSNPDIPNRSLYSKLNVRRPSSNSNEKRNSSIKK